LLADFILRRHADGELHFYCESLYSFFRR